MTEMDVGTGEGEVINASGPLPPCTPCLPKPQTLKRNSITSPSWTT
jgi:hypothetical protein